MKKLSVIVPVYNVEEYIDECLTSLVNQTLDDMEIIVVDDGSQDASIVKASKYPVKIVSKVNGGLSDARNFGLKYVEGEYVAFVDSDDYVALDMFEKLYTAAKKNNADIAVCDLDYVYDDGHHELSKGGYQALTSFVKDQKIIGINNSACNKIYRYNLFRPYRFPKGQLYEDLALIPILLAKANQVAYVEEALYFYRQRSGSIIHVLNEKIFDIYQSIANLKANIVADEKIFIKLYLDNCLMMTTYRIKAGSDAKTRILFYQQNIEYLNQDCPNWYHYLYLGNYTFKQKLIFTLLRFNCFKMVERIFR